MGLMASLIGLGSCSNEDRWSWARWKVMQHDGKGGLRFDERPFLVMNDQALVDLGCVDGPLL